MILVCGCAGLATILTAMGAAEWEVRNAASLAFAALVHRLLGFTNPHKASLARPQAVQVCEGAEHAPLQSAAGWLVIGTCKQGLLCPGKPDSTSQLHAASPSGLPAGLEGSVFTAAEALLIPPAAGPCCVCFMRGPQQSWEIR